MNQACRAALVFGLLAAGGAQAQTFTEAFDGTDGVTGVAWGTSGNFTNVTFIPGAVGPSVPSGQIGFVGHVGGDGFAQLGGRSTMSLTFFLDHAASSFSLSFWASSLLKKNETVESRPTVTLSNSFGFQTITGTTAITLNTANPGTNGDAADAGAFYTFTFAAPVSHPLAVAGTGNASLTTAPWAMGNYTLLFNNTPDTPGMRVDDIRLTAVAAVPEPFTVALALAGLGIVTIGARVSRKA